MTSSLRARVRALCTTAGFRTPSPEAMRGRDVLGMRDAGIQMYRTRMRREHPDATSKELDAMVWAWLAPGSTQEMKMNTTDSALRRAMKDLNAMGAQWAIIGGMAVSVLATRRFTHDVDFAVVVADDHEAEQLVLSLRHRGYYPAPEGQFNRPDGRLSTQRLDCPREGVTVDLLFASSGIEAEIVAGAVRIEVLDGLRAPVACRGHLIAMKALAGRRKDLDDLDGLFEVATDADIATAREACCLIQDRGFSPDKDLPATLEWYLTEGTPQ